MVIQGFVIDNVGRRATLFFMDAVFGLIGFLIMYWFNPIISLIFIGFAYTVFSSVSWSAIALIVDKGGLALAYGLFASIINLALTLLPITTSLIYSHTHSYYMVMIFLTLQDNFILLFYYDLSNNYICTITFGR